MPEVEGSPELDDASGVGAPNPTAAPPEDARPRTSYKPLIVAVVLAALVGALVLGGCQILFGMLLDEVGPGIVVNANFPPPGDIWFGESFDADSQTMTGISDTFATSDTFVVVISLEQAVETSDLRLQVVLDDEVIDDNPFDAGTGDFIYFTAGPLDDPGTYGLTVVDGSGEVLATGEMTVTDPHSSDSGGG